jgi:hypothetical protein
MAPNRWYLRCIVKLVMGHLNKEKKEEDWTKKKWRCCLHCHTVDLTIIPEDNIPECILLLRVTSKQEVEDIVSNLLLHVLRVFVFEVFELQGLKFEQMLLLEQ